MKLRKVLASGLIVTMVFSISSCSKSFKAKTSDEVVDILEELDYEQVEKMDSVKDNKPQYIRSSELEGKMSEYLSKTSEKSFQGALDDEIIAFYVPDNDNFIGLFYADYENEEDAREYFEDEIYDEVDRYINEESYFDGEIDCKLNKNSGYVLIRGTIEVEDLVSDMKKNVSKGSSSIKDQLAGGSNEDLSGFVDMGDLDIPGMGGIDMGDVAGMSGFSGLSGMSDFSLSNLFDFEMPKFEDVDVIIGIYYSGDTITYVVSTDNKASIKKYSELIDAFGFPALKDEK